MLVAFFNYWDNKNYFTFLVYLFLGLSVYFSIDFKLFLVRRFCIFIGFFLVKRLEEILRCRI